MQYLTLAGGLGVAMPMVVHWLQNSLSVSLLRFYSMGIFLCLFHAFATAFVATLLMLVVVWVLYPFAFVGCATWVCYGWPICRNAVFF